MTPGPDPPRGRWLRNAPTAHGPHCACGQLCAHCLEKRPDVVLGPPAGCRGVGLAAQWVGVYAPAETETPAAADRAGVGPGMLSREGHE